MNTKQQKWLFQGLVFLMLTVLAWVISDLLLLQVQAALRSELPLARPTTADLSQNAASVVDFDTLPSRSFFALAPDPTPAPSLNLPALEELTPSSLPLLLRGVWLGKGQAKAWAILEDPATGAQTRYRVGDPLPGGDATVAEILPRGVKIRRGASFELLSFPAAWGAASGQNSGASLASPSSKMSEDIRQVAPGRYVIGQKLVDHTLSNLTQFLTQARAIPVEGEGFRLRSIKSGSLIEKIGLQNNDMLRSVNGIELKSVEQAIKAFKLLQKESKLRLEVVRGNATQTFEYEIR